MKALTGMRALEAAAMFPPLSPRASLAGMLPALPPVLWKETPPQGLGSTSPNWSLQCGHWHWTGVYCHSPGRGIGTSRGCCGFVCRTHPAPFICPFFLQSCAANILLPQQVLEAASQAPSPSKATDGQQDGSTAQWYYMFSHIFWPLFSHPFLERLTKPSKSSYFQSLLGPRGSSVLVSTSINSN